MSEPNRKVTTNQLFATGWTVERASLYDEEGVEGWRWTSPEGEEHHVIGSWDEDAPPPEGTDIEPAKPQLAPMTEPAYTPGPYMVDRRWSNGCEVCPEIRAGNEWVATVVGAPHLGHGRTLPTAALLASAPDLYSALERLRGAFKGILAGTPVRDVEETLAEVDSALAKARGKETIR